MPSLNNNDEDNNNKSNKSGLLLSTMLSSSLSGMLSRIPLHPIDTCKAKLQIQNKLLKTPSYTGVIHCFKETIRTEGISGLYKGFPIAFFGSGPANCLYFTSYEINKKLLDNISFIQQHQFINNFTAGLLAECFSCILWVPIDVIKERLQVQSNILFAVKANNINNSIAYRSTIDAIITIAKTEGFRGIYRGYGATVASFGPYSALYLSLYEQFKLLALSITHSKSTSNLPFLSYLLCGASAGGLAAFITNPLDLAKLRIQVQRGNSGFTFGYRNIFHGMQQIVKTEGIAALFKGAGARMAFYVPSAALTIAMFDTLKQFFQRTLHQNHI
jgi:hypothetical protein